MFSSDLVKALHRYEMKVFSDSADPRLVQEIHNGGIKIYPVERGAGSVIAGIDKTELLNIFVIERSYNLREEFPNHIWGKDENGDYISQPIDAWNRGIDATRHWVLATLSGEIQRPESDIAVVFTK